jgi:hypothetical protein
MSRHTHAGHNQNNPSDVIQQCHVEPGLASISAAMCALAARKLTT